MACLAVATPAAAQGALAKAKAAKALVVGISGGNAPIAWMSASDQPLGITLDFCQAMLKREGIEKIDVYTMPFGSLIPALTSGRIDLACDTFFPTEKRKLLVDFSDILFYNSETLIVRKGNPKGIRKLADLGGKSAGSYEGTVWIDWINDLNKQGAKIESKAYPTPTELIADVAAGRLDGGIVDAVLAAYAVKQNPNLGIELVADYQPREKVSNAVALAVRKDSADLREAAQPDAGGDEGRRVPRPGVREVRPRAPELLPEAIAFTQHGRRAGGRGDGACLALAGLESPVIDRWLEWGPPLMRGTALTIFLTVASFAFALVLGLVLALARLNRRRWYLYKPAQGFVELVRGTPLLVQLFYLYFVLPFVGITMNPILTGVLGLGINYGAYMSEVYRAGIEAIDRSQWEAAHALAMPTPLILRIVVLPQAFRIVIPPMGNYLVSLFKDTAIVATISIRELLFSARLLAAETFQYFAIFTAVLVIYFAISYPASRGVAWLERRMRIGA